MLHCALPNVVVGIVLEKAAHVADKKIGDFREALPLLAVCRQWRHLALPIVYADAYYVYKSECTQWIDYSTIQRLSRISEHTYERTNVDLIASAGCINTVRRVHITMKYEGHPHGVVWPIAKRLREVAAVWSRVEYLGFVDTVLSRGIQVKEAQSTANVFIGMFPGVRRLVHDLPNDNGFNDLGNLLAAGYAKQLRMYNGIPVALPQGCVLERLERATITYLREVYHRDQHIQPSTLKHLRLETKCREHPWDMFVGDRSNSSGGGDVEFPNLKSLTVSYPETGHLEAIAHQPRLHFPRLQTLNLRYRGNDFGFLQHAVFPAHIAKFVVHAPAAAFDSLWGIALPDVEQLTVTVSSDLPDPNALVHVGQFLSNTRGGKQELTIRCSVAGLLPELVPCTRLTSVRVTLQVGIESVMSFVAGLQFLETLEFADVRMSTLPADMRIVTLTKHKPLKPLNSSLQTLSLAFHHKGKARVAAAVAKYLLMRLPNLTMFSVPSASVQPVLDFAQKYSQFYPHLENAERVFLGGS